MICFDSEQPPCFSGVIILGCNLIKIWASAQKCWSCYKGSPEFHLLSQYYGVLTSDLKQFSELRNMCNFGTWKSVSNQALITWSEGILPRHTTNTEHTHSHIDTHYIMGITTNSNWYHTTTEHQLSTISTSHSHGDDVV